MSIAGRVKGVVFCLAGVVLATASWITFQHARAFMRLSRVAPGVVIAETVGPHHVEIRFQPQCGGKPLTYHQNGEINLHTGEAVMVRYDPHDPAADPCVNTWPALWGTCSGLGGMAAVFLTLGAAMATGRLRG